MQLHEEQDKFIGNLKNKDKSFNTIKNYRTDLNIFNQFLLEKKKSLKVNEITHDELKEYQFYLEKKYTSSNSIRRRIQALRLFFDYLISQNILDANPLKKIATSPKNVKLPRPIAFAEIQMLEAYLVHKFENSEEFEKLLALRNILIMHLIYEANLKVSVIEKLKITHFLLNEDSTRVLIIPEKQEPFSIPLSDKCRNYIDQYLVLLEKQKNKDRLDFDNFLFNGNPYKILRGGLSARGIEILFKHLSTKLKTDLSARDLRQSCIFKWLNQGVADSTIKEWMGVQPQYSLAPFKMLIKQDPAKYVFQDL